MATRVWTLSPPTAGWRANQLDGSVGRAAAPVGSVADPHHQPASFARRLGRPGIGSQQPVAEAAGDRGTADVLLVAADEHASYAVEAERDIRERRAGTGGKTAAFRIGTDPVSDLHRAGPPPRIRPDRPNPDPAGPEQPVLQF